MNLKLKFWGYNRFSFDTKKTNKQTNKQTKQNKNKNKQKQINKNK